MESQEAVVNIKKLKNLSFDEDKSTFECTCDMAIDALEKQVQKKPIEIKGFVRSNRRKLYKCPVCESEVTFCEHYCDYCGQAIDWSEDEVLP